MGAGELRNKLAKSSESARKDWAFHSRRARRRKILTNPKAPAVYKKVRATWRRRAGIP
jgi:hypothetical protein